MRQVLTWTIFVACLAVVLAAMGWTTRTVVRLDRAQVEARQQADFEQTVRLALWRMESSLSPLIAQESSYPYFAYDAFSPLNAVYPLGTAGFRSSELLVPSPLIAQTNPQVVMRFQFNADGVLVSPQVPLGNMRDLAEKQGYCSSNSIEEANVRLVALNKTVARDRLRSLLPAPQPPQPMVVNAPPPQLPQSVAQQIAPRFGGQSGQQAAQQAEQRFAQDNQVRAVQQQRLQVVAQNFGFSNSFNGLVLPQGDGQGSTIATGLMQPVWVDGLLLLARRVSVSGRELIQGSQLDWAMIRQTLLADIADLLPAATLEPVAVAATATRSTERDYLRLAALPVRLVPGAAMAGPVMITPGLKYSLISAWAGVLLAVLAAAVLLKGALALSERRAAFVSAVTHELRTPLTTFKLYTEMLEQGRAAGEDRQRQYLGTLRNQADRLCHLVENVLAYARLERGRKSRRCEAVSIDGLLGQIEPRLADRSAQAGMNLRLRSVGPTRSEAVRVLVDPSAIEQILLNLVDNACKYAAGVENRTIEIGALGDGTRATIRVRDHGPGIPAREQRKVFRPFHKSAHQAADSAPGVGLGLSLSRRLAREMGGDLWVDPAVTDGACFVLTLRTV